MVWQEKLVSTKDRLIIQQGNVEVKIILLQLYSAPKRKATKAKYGDEDKWMTNEVSTPYGVSLWRSIRIMWPCLRNNTTVRVGNRSKTSFILGGQMAGTC